MVKNGWKYADSVVRLHQEQKTIPKEKGIYNMTKKGSQKQMFEIIKKAIESGNHTNEKLSAMIYRNHQLGMITRKQATELTFMF